MSLLDLVPDIGTIVGMVEPTCPTCLIVLGLCQETPPGAVEVCSVGHTVRGGFAVLLTFGVEPGNEVLDIPRLDLKLAEDREGAPLGSDVPDTMTTTGFQVRAENTIALGCVAVCHVG